MKKGKINQSAPLTREQIKKISQVLGSKVVKDVVRILKMSPAQREKHEKKEREAIIERADLLAKLSDDFAFRIAFLADQNSPNPVINEISGIRNDELVKTCDWALAILLRHNPLLCVPLRIPTTESVDLLYEASSAIHHTRDFIRAIDRITEIKKGEEDEIKDLISYYAGHVHSLVEHLTELCRKHPKAAEGAGADYPNWPFLLFDRKSAPSEFKELAGIIGLGTTCVINAGESAKFHWGTPLNRYIFNLLWEWQDLKRSMSGKDFVERSERQRLENLVFSKVGKPTERERAEIEIFEKSLKLDRLTRSKASVKDWSKTLIMPLIELREGDLEESEALKKAVAAAPYETRSSRLNSVRKAVELSLMAMAKPGS